MCANVIHIISRTVQYFVISILTEFSLNLVICDFPCLCGQSVVKRRIIAMIKMAHLLGVNTFLFHIRYIYYKINLITQWGGNGFDITGSVWRKSAGGRWIALSKGHECENLVLSVLLTWTSRWANNRNAGDLRRFDIYVPSVITTTIFRNFSSTHTIILSYMFKLQSIIL